MAGHDLGVDDGVSRSAGGGKMSVRRVIATCMVGTALEWYDFFLFAAAAALVFNKLFFPSFDPLVGTLLALSTYAVGFVSRPLGAVVFGHFGDRSGRKSALMVTLMIMGVASFAIGLLPTYNAVGILAPVLLVTLRFLQGVGIGGEWGGAVLLLAEHGDRSRRGFFTSLPQLGVPLGNLLATGVLGLLAAMMSDAAFLSWGWRLPFLLSAALLVVGIYTRLKVSESPAYRAAEQKQARPPRIPIIEVLKNHRRATLIGIGASFSGLTGYYIFTIASLTYVTTTLGLSKALALNAVLAGSAVAVFAVPLFGAASDRFGRRPIYIFGGAGIAVWSFVFFPILDTKSPALIALAIVVGLVFWGATSGVQASFIAELFDTHVRYSGASFAYQISSVVAGALTPIIAIALFNKFGTALAMSAYTAGMVLISIVSILVAKETAGARIEQTAAEPESIPA